MKTLTRSTGLLLFFIGVTAWAVWAEPTKTTQAEGALVSSESLTAVVPTAPKKAKAKLSLPDADPEFAEQKDLKAVSVTGPIVARNGLGMAIELKSDPATGESDELWVNFNKNTKLSGAKLSELEAGDRVKIQYKETKDQRKKMLVSIQLVEKKPKETTALVASEAPVATAAQVES